MIFFPMILSKISLYCLKQVTGRERRVYETPSSAGTIDIFCYLENTGMIKEWKL